jgi:hypothetical protein
MCPRKRKVSKFQVLRYRDRTRNRWRTTKVVLNVFVSFVKTDVQPQSRMHDDGLVTGVTITFKRANFIWGFYIFQKTESGILSKCGFRKKENCILEDKVRNLNQPKHFNCQIVSHVWTQLRLLKMC